MAEEDFDVASLAAYLHLTPQQVERLADRDRIPFRRVGGKLRFSRAEIHHWMERQMGLLGDHELARVEDRLQRSGADEPFNVATMLQWNTTAVPLVARTRNSVISAMTDLAAASGLLWDPQKIAEAVRAREDMQSTAMDNGVALLHPRRPLPNVLEDGVLALGMTAQGIPFGGSRELTDVFWLICSIDDQSHLRILARISRLLASDRFLDRLREAPDAQSAFEWVKEVEESLH